MLQLLRKRMGALEPRQLVSALPEASVLIAITDDPEAPEVILTLRADFYGRPMNYATLGSLLEERSRSVLPMSVIELREVIEGPASQPDVQLQFEEGLVGDLLFEVQGQSGALPMLQFTLDRHRLAMPSGLGKI